MTEAENYRRAYREMIDLAGQFIKVRRYTGVGINRPVQEVEVRARVTNYAAEELVGTIQQGDRKVIVLAEDLINAQFPMPLTGKDVLLVQGRELQIISPDDSTRRLGPDLIAYELVARG